MPRITITEQEEVALANFDVSENTVAIPMLYALHESLDPTGKRKVDEALPKPMYYTSANQLKLDFKDGAGLEGKCRRYVFVDPNGTFKPETDKPIIADNMIDKSYAMAYELLANGMNVVIVPIELPRDPSDPERQSYLQYDEKKAALINLSAASETIPDYGYVIPEEKYRQLLADAVRNGVLECLKDKNLYNVKFITSGAYANMYKDEQSYWWNVVDVAKERRDAVAMVEPEESIRTPMDFDAIDASGVNDDCKYAACFFPTCQMTLNCGPHAQTRRTMPACFAYLMAYANSVKTNANWFAAAGTERGRIPNMIAPSVDVGEGFMHWLQNDELADVQLSGGNRVKFNVNPIYNAGVYGYRIWGNRVMWQKDATINNLYQEYLNVRILMCDVKKQIYHAAMRTTFEPNDDVVWYSFKSLANTLLDRMKSGRGIRWYKWVKEADKRKALIKATLTIQPIEAVESFEINVVLSDEEVEVEE